MAAMLAVLVSLGPLSMPTAAATTFHVQVGGETGDHAIQALAFLPNDITIDVGDTVEFPFPTAEPHTVTFAAPPGTPLTEPKKCNGLPSATDSCVWTGTSEVNSGQMEEGDSYSVTFMTPPGTYPFVCLIHPQMTGTIRVQAAGSPYPNSPQDVNSEGKRQESQLLSRGSQMRGQELAAADPAHGQINVGAGFVTTTSGGAQSVAILRFLPQAVTVKVGDTVTWNAQDPATPHTVTFGVEPTNIFSPVGLDAPGHATLTQPYPERFVGPTISSGFMGQGPGRPGGTTFRATFMAAGVYQYYCALHDELGMVGTITVLPNNDASVQQSISPSPVPPGGVTTFTVSLNLGSPQQGVHLQETLTGAGQSPATRIVPGSARLDGVLVADPNLATNSPNRLEYDFALGNLGAGHHTLTYQLQLSPTLKCFATLSSGLNLDLAGHAGHLDTDHLAVPIRCP